ncbi:choline dehydrogenase-like flavoprotein [Arthrobacter globiformis]|nr:choline dehydrogenase-like flavoprotein [Arthrobacter globiformis]
MSRRQPVWNGAGGSTVVYASQWQRNAPAAFRVEPLDGLGDDWPTTYENLVPFYPQLEAGFGVSGKPSTCTSTKFRESLATDGTVRRNEATFSQSFA